MIRNITTPGISIGVIRVNDLTSISVFNQMDSYYLHSLFERSSNKVGHCPCLKDVKPDANQQGFSWYGRINYKQHK